MTTRMCGLVGLTPQHDVLGASHAPACEGAASQTSPPALPGVLVRRRRPRVCGAAAHPAPGLRIAHGPPEPDRRGARAARPSTRHCCSPSGPHTVSPRAPATPPPLPTPLPALHPPRHTRPATPHAHAPPRRPLNTLRPTRHPYPHPRPRITRRAPACLACAASAPLPVDCVLELTALCRRTAQVTSREAGVLAGLRLLNSALALDTAFVAALSSATVGTGCEAPKMR
jgi:hypothetical protein